LSFSPEILGLNTYVDISEKSYELYTPLNELWKSYMEEILKDAPEAAISGKLSKADYHGALLTGTKLFMIFL
jgi:hypothetical protein